MTALDFTMEQGRSVPDTVIDALLALELAADDLREMQVSTLVERDAWDARINAQREARHGPLHG